MKLIKIEEATTKSEICGTILCMLPNWFGVEASIVDYYSGMKQTSVFFGKEYPALSGLYFTQAHCGKNANNPNVFIFTDFD